MIKDSAAWIELGGSFEGTVHVKVHESFIISRMQNVSIQAFQSNVIYAIFQTFNPLGKINPWQQFKRGYWNSVGKTRTWQPCIQQELQESDLTDHRSRIRRDYWKDHAWVFSAQQILSSLTNIWSCKMCSLYTECVWSRDRKRKYIKIFKYTTYR